MFIQMSIDEIKSLEQKQVAIHISLWDSLEKAEKFYSPLNGLYTAYKEENKNLISAFSTPVKIYRLYTPVVTSPLPLKS
ncbi:hypothetical protein [Paenibacillus sp. BR1-192]|uniref:hypothetical protein n=1 Tax=Paenibacillus sp. BR1-192 TaxID=3032287 RepID=UPI00240E78FB|nr:hypothetical protein [Paenibacillus sp. BR1-192]WFB58556.1 hypothetical protein P0X86_32355 [Paenibacillus sp. BR1-192]